MTGWFVATAATVALGAAGVGAALSPVVHGQSAKPLLQDDAATWISEPEQTVRILSGSGSQIGISIRDLGDEDLKTTKASTGVVIDEVEADSPAQKAGFKAGDVVVEFDGERVRSMRQFTRLVQETPAGRQVSAAVMRDGQRVTVSVQPRAGQGFKYFDRLGDLTPPKVPPPPPVAFDRDFNFPKFEMLLGSGGRLGITVDALPQQLAEYFGVKEGVLVTSVNDNSPASKAGLKAGDVITSINGGTVTTTADLRRRAQRLEDGDEFTLSVIRDKKPVAIKGKIELPAGKRYTARTVL